MRMKFTLVTLSMLSLFGCKKADVIYPVTPSGSSVPVIDVNVDQSHPGIAIPANFQGLSFETSILATNPTFLNASNTALIQLVKNLGPGVLRLGGNSSDNLTWSGLPRTSTTSTNVLATTDIDNLAGFSNAIGWPVLFGLNMGTYNPAAAATEAKYVSSSLQGNLLAFQAGNEPDGYKSWNPKRSSTYDYPNYKPEWEAYYNAVKAAVPTAPFAGPDVAYQSYWVTNFANDENKKVILLDGHYYQSGPASDPSVTYHNLFSPIPAYPNYFTVLNAAAVKYNIPYRISECNSINGGGKTGVSDVFGSALWTLDFMWMVATNNGQGVNFHGGNGGPYSPVVEVNGAVTARPEYYAMLAFKYAAANATIVPTSIASTGYSYSAYSCIRGNNTAVTLINKETSQNLIFRIQVTNTASAVHIARLNAPSITSTSGITFMGSTVNNDGTFAAGKTEDYTINSKVFTVTVPAASAAVVTVQ